MLIPVFVFHGAEGAFCDKAAVMQMCIRDSPYVKGENFVTVLDGFILSDNVTCTAVENIDAGFRYSDHNPVLLTFQLEEK